MAETGIRTAGGWEWGGFSLPVASFDVSVFRVREEEQLHAILYEVSVKKEVEGFVSWYPDPDRLFD